MKLINYIYIGIGLVIATLIATVSIQSSKIKRISEDWSISRANEKALMLNNDSLKNHSRVLSLTIEQLEYYNDSLIDKMNEVRRELKIKDRNLQQMQYLLSEAKKRDTVIIKDTIFKNNMPKIDTTFGDRWYSITLGLSFPNIIVVEPKFISEKYIMASYRKETVNPPKKCFLARWFQKKHKIVEVEVVEKNPYIENKQQRFIKIIE